MATSYKLEKKEYIPKEWESICCNICGSNDSKIYEKFGNKLQYTYNKCLNCKNVFSSPRPKYDEEFVYHAYEFYAVEFDHYQNGFNSTNVKSDVAKHKKEVEEILKFCKNTNSILDVGCEAGRFVYAAKSQFENIYGLEVSESMAAFVEKEVEIKVFREVYEKLKLDIRFDCIRMSHVIEHIPDPNIWLQKTKEVLHENGILVLNIPNIYSLNRKIKLFLNKMGLKKNRWQSWRTPDHLYEPSIPAMLFLLKKHDYKVLSYYTYSNKNLASRGFLSSILHRFFKIGNNLRIICQL